MMYFYTYALLLTCGLASTFGYAVEPDIAIEDGYLEERSERKVRDVNNAPVSSDFEYNNQYRKNAYRPDMVRVGPNMNQAMDLTRQGIKRNQGMPLAGHIKHFIGQPDSRNQRRGNGNIKPTILLDAPGAPASSKYNDKHDEAAEYISSNPKKQVFRSKRDTHANYNVYGITPPSTIARQGNDKHDIGTVYDISPKTNKYNKVVARSDDETYPNQFQPHPGYLWATKNPNNRRLTNDASNYLRFHQPDVKYNLNDQPNLRSEFPSGNTQAKLAGRMPAQSSYSNQRQYYY